jgi:hypothetical protein
MRLIALGAASAIATVLSFGVEAADYAYPPAAVGPPQYGVAPSAAVAPPQVRVAPGAPVPVPRYNGAPVPPAVVGSSPSPYGVSPPVAPPGVAPASPLPPRAACGPIWRCENGGCGWSSDCAPPLDHYSGPSGSPQVYSGREAPRPPDPYAGSYGSPGPQVYSGREALPPAPYSGPYAPQVSGPYGRQVYSGAPGRMRWMIGPQPYGM